MGRPDPVLNMFKDQNLIPLLMPQSGIHPLQLVGIYGKNLIPLGDISTALQAPGWSPPPVIEDTAMPGILEGKSSARVKLSIGLEILGKFLKAATGKTLDFSIAYQKAKTLTFKFSGVTAERVEISRLDQYLGKANIHPDSVHIERMMIEDSVGILTTTLKSKKFVINAQQENGREIGVDLPVLREAAGGSVQIETENEAGTGVSYEGTVAVTFAIQGIRMFFDDSGHYTAFDPFKAGQHAVRSQESMGMDTSRYEPRFLAVGAGFGRFGGEKGARAALE